MKLLLFCITLFFWVSSNVYAEQIVSEVSATPTWTLREHPSVNFPILYTLNGCSVSVREDGRGITVDASDSNWRGMHITQTFVIQEHAGGAFYLFGFTRETGVRNAGYILSIDTEGYDVFEAKCLESARLLPKNVQKAFHGYYGLGAK